ncbi:pyrroline-5-carboxylate reductase [Caballeronia sp. 15715]|uniref:pyrroline-5-carboxylate reductase n=1 Tax=Caballeronia sp. 15715 TaxID=3391030 RepID=UPI0039E4CB9E
MKIGFVGTGAISEAVITGLLKTRSDISEITVSPRNAEVSSRLARSSSLVRVGRDNQDVVDSCDTVFLAVRPQISKEVVTALRFRANHHIVNIVGTLTHETLHRWIETPVTITRAIPLPLVADLRGVTPIYPPNNQIANLFAPLGPVIECNDSAHYDCLAVASALMETYFGMLEICQHWLVERGLLREEAMAYLKDLAFGLSQTMMTSQSTSFESLRFGHTTPGGLNEQMYRVFREQGGARALTSALDSVLTRVESSLI